MSADGKKSLKERKAEEDLPPVQPGTVSHGAAGPSGCALFEQYLDLPNEPLFSGFSAQPIEARPGDKVTLEVKVSNDGEGEETALFFPRDRVASVSRPGARTQGCQEAHA